MRRIILVASIMATIIGCAATIRNVEFGETLDKCVTSNSTRAAADACRCDAGDTTHCLDSGTPDAGPLDSGKD